MHLQASLSSRSSSTTAGLSSFWKLKKGVRITITSNIDLANRLINGQFGVVFDFAYIDSSITKVYVKLDDQNAGKNAMSKDLYASKYKVVPIQRIEANIIISKNSSETFKRTQFPLTLAWTCTVHKVSLELIKQRSFSPGQIYVALSRSTSLSKLNILSDFDPKIVEPNHLALEHYKYLRKERNLFTQRSSLKKPFLTLLNIRGIVTNILDFTGDSRLLHAPPIRLTESNLLQSSNLSGIPISNTYQIIRNDDEIDRLKA